MTGVPSTILLRRPARADERRAGTAERWLLVLGFAMLVCLRMPGILLHGRFWAEEGTYFFRETWQAPWQQALLMPIGGYLNLVANLAAILARHLTRLEYAPYVTTGVALLFQACPAIVLATSRADWLQRRAVLITALLIIATLPVSEEVWLNSLHSQFHLMLCAALILALPLERGGRAAFHVALLLLGPLCGPGGAFLVPLFLLRALLDRSSGRLLQAGVLGVPAAAQILLFYTATPSRSYGIGLPLLLCVLFVRNIVVPFLGRTGSLDVAARVQAGLAAGHPPVAPMLVVLLVAAALAVAFRRRARPEPAWLFLAGGVIAALSYYGAIDGRANLLMVGFGQRYVFVPSVLFGLSLLALAATGADRLSAAAWGLVLWLVFVGAHEYFWTDPLIDHGPDWRTEVALWRRDPSHVLAIWPEGWTMELDPSRRR